MQRRGVRRPPAHLLQFGARQARRVALDQEQAHARRALAAGTHRDRQVIGAHARGDEGLLAADDVMAAGATRPGAQVGDIGAAAGLGDRQCGYLLAGENFRQYSRPHFRPGGARDRRRADGVAHQARTDAAGAGAREFLRGHDLHELVGGDAAKFFGEAQAQQADFRGLLIQRARELAGLVPFMREGLDLPLDKAAHDVAKGFMFGGVEGAFHARRFPGAANQNGGNATAQLASSG